MYYPSFRKRGKVPILSGDEINSIAEKYIWDFDSGLLKNIGAIDIEGFLEFYLNLEMEYDDLSSDGSCLGMTVFNNTTRIVAYDKGLNKAKYITASEGTIIIDNSLLEANQERRLRFTLGHEAGHWIFHKEYYGYNPGQLTLFEINSPYAKCRNIEANYLYDRTKNWDDEKWMEWQADKFSACLLMPKCSVRIMLKDIGNINEKISLIEKTVNRVADTFLVSRQAAFYRLCDLKYISTQDQERSNYQLSLFD